MNIFLQPLTIGEAVLFVGMLLSCFEMGFLLCLIYYTFYKQRGAK